MKLLSDYNGHGGIREVFLLAMPMVVSTACDGVMTFTDRLFLARVGPDEMNAVMGGAVAMQVLTFFFVGLTGYSTALVAQYFGAHERTTTTRAAFQAMLVTVAAWPVIILLKPLTSAYFQLMHIPDSQIGYQIQYIDILVWGSIFGLMRYTLGCYFIGIGKTKIVMTATITAMLVNVVLGYILIFGKLGFPAMSIAGAAIATVSGSICAVIILITAYLSPVNRREFGVAQSFLFDRVIMKKLLFFGYPAGVEFFLNLLAFSAMISLFQAQGVVVATASTILFSWDLISFIPLVGIELAVTSLVGRYMGARQPDVAEQAAISGINTGMVYSVVVLSFFLFAPEMLVRVFSPAHESPIFEQAVPIAVAMLRIAMLYILLEAVLSAVIGALRGAGDTHFAMMASVTAHWTVVPILFVSMNVLHFPVVTSWFIMVVFFLMFFGVLIYRFSSGAWKHISVIGPSADEVKVESV